jgi:hypothetical protein
MLEEPYQVLFEDDYESGYPQLRYHRHIPCKCPCCGVWSHHVLGGNHGRSLVKCPLCDYVYDAGQYQQDAMRRLRSRLRKFRDQGSNEAIV